MSLSGPILKVVIESRKLIFRISWIPEVKVLKNVSREFLVGRILIRLDPCEHRDRVIRHPGEDRLTHGALPPRPSLVKLPTFHVDALVRKRVKDQLRSNKLSIKEASQCDLKHL